MKSNNVKFKGRLRTYFSWPLILTIALIFIDILVYTKDITSGAVISVFIVVYFLIILLSYIHNKPLLVQEMVNFATQYATVQKQLLYEFEVPYALIDYNGKILWLNEQFMELTGKDKKYHKSITTIFPLLTRELLQKTEMVGSVNLTLEDRTYRAVMKRIYFDSMTQDSSILVLEQDSEYLTALYLFDETEMNRYIRENEEEKMVAGLVYIDNYDEALDSIEDVKRSLLVALIDRKVNKYFTEIDALVRKIEKDKYFVVFKYKYLAKLREDRFNLLEDVKTVKVGNEMAVTISMGIGADAGSFAKNSEYAKIAIDLALGRGGDQVVLKDGSKIQYFGGKTQAVEKNTRVKARVKAHALKEFMNTKEKVVVMGHRLPDADSFGAAIGIYRAAKTLNKKAYIVIDNPTSSIIPLMNTFRDDQDYEADMFVNNHEAKEIMDDNTLLVVVDTNKPSITQCEDLLYMAKMIVVLDHHRQGSDTIRNSVLSYIEPYASSASEMVAEILQYFTEGIRIRNVEADSIYAGIMIDTDNFMQKTGVRTFEAAAFLRRCGADVTRVRKLFREDMNDYKARGETIRNAELFRGQFAISECPSDYVDSPTVVGAQAANELLNIVGVKASFVLTEYKGVIYISARAIDEVNVQIIMERMGGGGHLNMAGCQLETVDLEGARSLLKSTLTEMQDGGEI